MNPETSRLRLAVVGVVTLSLFAAMFARLWYLQVMDSRTFVAAATSNQVRFVYEEAPRGRIVDRQGRVLVDNARSQAITVDRAVLGKLPNQEEIKTRLAALLNLPMEELEKRLADVRYSPYKPIPVAEDVPEEIVVYLKEHSDDFPAVEATLLARRSYPNGNLAAHLVGYVGEINGGELEARKGAGYRLGDTIGKSGTELTYEPLLRGTPGIKKLQVDATGKVLGDPLGFREPKPGQDVQLTVDLDVQRLAEESLAQGLEAARGTIDRDLKKHFVAPAGAAVVMDPRDGSLLAMASFPTYNPGDFVNGIRPEVFQVLNDPANHYPLNNRALMGQYPPGSTFKLITALAALKQGMIIPKTSITDEGVYKVPNCRGEKCTFRNANGTRFGRVDLPRSLTVSSDVYYYALGARFWLERTRFGEMAMQDTAAEFGFGRKTGIPLPADKAGVIPSREWKKDFCKNVRCIDDRWFTGDSINMSIGQGNVLATPLQLANAYATFANGGTLFEPRFAAHEPPKSVRKIDLPPAMRDPVNQGLAGVISREEGTAYGAFLGFPNREFPVAGKTGTAQVTTKQDTALFVAYAPVTDPQYVVAVVMEESGFGGAVAAPVARRILQGIAGQPPGPIQVAEGSD